MVDIDKFLETEYRPDVRTKILRVLAITGNVTLGVLHSRLKSEKREDVLDELKRMRDDGLITVEPYVRRGQHTLMIKS